MNKRSHSHLHAVVYGGYDSSTVSKSSGTKTRPVKCCNASAR